MKTYFINTDATVLRAEYTLFYKLNNIPLAVVEAKHNHHAFLAEALINEMA